MMRIDAQAIITRSAAFLKSNGTNNQPGA